MVRNDLISQYMNWTQRTEHRDMTDHELRDVIVTFLVAGRDTTGLCGLRRSFPLSARSHGCVCLCCECRSAVTLSWFFYSMTRYPAIRKKVVEEIDSVRHARPFFAQFSTLR